MSGAIEFIAVTVATRQGQRLLDDVSLSVEAGTTTVLLGRSGSGKTTLLRTVNRMVAPTGGEVLVNGSSVRDADLILVLRDGEVVEQGSHAQLMAAQGLYRGLIELQFKEG